jgi:hypothetical protein
VFSTWPFARTSASTTSCGPPSAFACTLQLSCKYYGHLLVIYFFSGGCIPVDVVSIAGSATIALGSSLRSSVLASPSTCRSAISQLMRVFNLLPQPCEGYQRWWRPRGKRGSLSSGASSGHSPCKRRGGLSSQLCLPRAGC